MQYNRYYNNPRGRSDGMNHAPKHVRRYTATIGDASFVRNSPNVYTHVVVGHKGTTPLEVLKWCNSGTQAATEADIRVKAGYSDVQVVDVVASPYKKEFFPDKK